MLFTSSLVHISYPTMRWFPIFLSLNLNHKNPTALSIIVRDDCKGLCLVCLGCESTFPGTSLSCRVILDPGGTRRQQQAR